VPLVAPPTPARLEQDKAAIDEEFTRAFDLIDQLAADTAAIKASEAARQERLDTALAELEQATQDMKSNSRRREDDIRRIAEDVKSFQGLIPKAMKAQEESNDARLRELNTELVSLKKLVAGRLGGSETSAPQMTPTTNGANMFGVNGTVGTGVDMNSLVKQDSASKLETTGTASASARSTNASPFSTFGSRGGIPAWQMAASKKTETPATVTESTPDTEQTLS
jgi:peroxin-14